MCQQFLQVRYHHDGEFLPDKFTFENALSSRELLLGHKPSSVKGHVFTGGHASSTDSDDELTEVPKTKAELDEEDTRALTALAMRALVVNQPFHNALVGPGQNPGPRRYLGVVKPVILYEMLAKWCAQTRQLPAPSFTTFRRALKASRGYLSFRKSAGQHGLCDHCVFYKTSLRKSTNSRERAILIEQYAGHLLQSWRDRAIDASWHAQACETRQATLLGSAPVGSLPHSTLMIRSDGLDQAKHRVPRVMVKSKSFEELVRPAMHVQMVWAHTYGISFAIADPDFRKDSSTHMDALARCMSKIYDKMKSLPRHVYLVLDNTSRDNKNQHMLRFWCKLHVLQVFETIYIAFPTKGHTHGPLDGVGGHATVRCCNETFDTAAELVQVYDKFLADATFEEGTFFQDAYKHDNAADWQQWQQELPLEFSFLTGPKAPHGFRILSRKALTPADLAEAQQTSHVLPGTQPRPDDLMMAVYQHMSDAAPFQICWLLASAEVSGLRRSMAVQPSGLHPRRAISQQDRQQVKQRADAGFKKGAISENAHHFLTSWIQETLRREPRPTEYSFLKHCLEDKAGRGTGVAVNPHSHGPPRPVAVMHRDGPMVPEQDSWQQLHRFSLLCFYIPKNITQSLFFKFLHMHPVLPNPKPLTFALPLIHFQLEDPAGQDDDEPCVILEEGDVDR